MDNNKGNQTGQECIEHKGLLEKLTDEQFNRILQNHNTFLFEKGEIICSEGNEIINFLFLQKGLIKLLKTGKNNKEHIINVAKPDDFIGLLNFFSRSEYLYSVTAIEDSVVCGIDFRLMKQLLEENSGFAMDIIEKISLAANDAVNARLKINSRQLRGRIAYIILFFAEHIYGKDHFELPISRKEIAQLIDMSTENVIRILSEFRKDKIISIDGKKITILDHDRLKRVYELG